MSTGVGIAIFLMLGAIAFVLIGAVKALNEIGDYLFQIEAVLSCTMRIIRGKGDQ
jgi:hypothetical protein